MNALAARRRHPAAIAVLIMLALFLTGAVYAALAPKAAEAATVSADQVAEGKQLFVANCATCHGLNAQGHATGDGSGIAGPALAGVGSASVDFQMGTGRMPMAAPGIQAPAKPKIQFSQQQIDAIGAYIDSLAPGPTVPSEEAVDPTKGDPARGGEIFRVNCAMCHNSQGPVAPSPAASTPRHCSAPRPSTSTRRWRPARRACRSSTTPTSRPTTSATSSPTSRPSRTPPAPVA